MAWWIALLVAVGVVSLLAWGLLAWGLWRAVRRLATSVAAAGTRVADATAELDAAAAPAAADAETHAGSHAASAPGRLGPSRTDPRAGGLASTASDAP